MSVAWLVIPTYQEADNVRPIVEAALEHLKLASADHRVLIVDDKSPDGTGEIADALAAEHDAVEVLHRAGKEGLGPAYLAGFKRALARGADLILEMDADFSHRPADIPRLIEAVAHADLVLGSRYVPQGGVAGWELKRLVLSRAGCWYARTILGVPVRDLTGGFKCFRREVLETLDLSGIHADGYGFQIEMTYRAIRAGFRVKEIPIVFEDRRAGESKMSRAIAREAFLNVLKLRWRLRGRR
jgi:dolichol-phosphate mannosyltransferase